MVMVSLQRTQNRNT